jgi:hypothetical protein
MRRRIGNEDLERQILVAKEQLRTDKEVPQAQVAEWKFVNEIYGAR